MNKDITSTFQSSGITSHVRVLLFPQFQNGFGLETSSELAADSNSRKILLRLENLSEEKHATIDLGKIRDHFLLQLKKLDNTVMRMNVTEELNSISKEALNLQGNQPLPESEQLKDTFDLAPLQLRTFRITYNIDGAAQEPKKTMERCKDELEFRTKECLPDFQRVRALERQQQKMTAQLEGGFIENLGVFDKYAN